MKKLFYSLAVALFSVAFVACSNDDHDDFGTTTVQQDITKRATALGFDDADAYRESVAAQCAAGNHENCDIYNDGTHQACAYADHSGRNHDGSHHNGTNHGTHDQNGGHGHGNGNHH